MANEETKTYTFDKATAALLGAILTVGMATINRDEPQEVHALAARAYANMIGAKNRAEFDAMNVVEANIKYNRTRAKITEVAIQFLTQSMTEEEVAAAEQIGKDVAEGKQANPFTKEKRDHSIRWTDD